VPILARRLPSVYAYASTSPNDDGRSKRKQSGQLGDVGVGQPDASVARILTDTVDIVCAVQSDLAWPATKAGENV
jgi:hypothetical protein